MDAKYAHLEGLFRRVTYGKLDGSRIKILGSLARKPGGEDASEEGGVTEIPWETRMVDVADMVERELEFQVALLEES